MICPTRHTNEDPTAFKEWQLLLVEMSKEARTHVHKTAYAIQASIGYTKPFWYFVPARSLKQAQRRALFLSNYLRQRTQPIRLTGPWQKMRRCPGWGWSYRH